MKNTVLIPVFVLPLLAACNDPRWALNPTAAGVDTAAAGAVVTSGQPTLDPNPPPPPPPTARTVEQFDTTTAEARAAAVAVVAEPAGERRLGTTNAALGSAADPGIWLKTGLVSSLVPGRVENPANGKSVNLELRPSGAAATAASQISLAAMRLLELPLTALADLIVFQQPGADGS